MPYPTKTNWPEVIKDAIILRSQGKTLKFISEKHGCNLGNLAMKLRTLSNKQNQQTTKHAVIKAAFMDDGQNDTLPSNSLLSFSPNENASDLEKARFNARKLLSNAVSGKAEPSAQQIAAARLLLAGELEPAEDVNPYIGIPEDELAERSLVCACSVLGVDRVQTVLDGLKRSGMADVLGRPGEIPAEATVTLAADPELTRQASEAGQTHEALTLDSGEAVERTPETLAPKPDTETGQASPVEIVELPG